MAANEIKSVQVAPSEEESTINLWQSFGWELMGAPQEVRTSDSSHLERRGDSIYNVTKAGEHYIKITFQRDPSRQNYAELVSLEKQHHANFENTDFYKPYPSSEAPKMFGLLWGILSVVGLFCAIWPGAIIIIWRFVSQKNRITTWQESSEAYKAWSEAYNAFLRNKTELLEKARALV